MNDTATIRLWKCTVCGKWSHAAKNPRHHRRFDRNEPADGSKILEEIPPIYSPEHGDSSEGGYMVRCGPFEAWTAVKGVRLSNGLPDA